MKFGLAIAPPNASPLAFVVFRDDLEVSMRKAKELGYDGVELALLSAEEVKVDELRLLLDRYRLSLPVISTGRIFGEEKLFFTNPDSGRRREAVERFKGIISVASKLGAKVNIGRVRGFIPEGEAKGCAEGQFIECMRECADYAAELGVELLLEPVNRYEINYINNVMEGLEALKKVDRSNLKLMPDVFHMNIEDASIEGSLRVAGDAIGYVHFADSNRWAPGQGHLDFRSILRALRDIGYDGFITLEILPVPDPDTAARLGIEYLESLMKALS